MAAGGGLALGASFPPLGLWLLAPLGVALATGALLGRTARSRFALGSIVGLAQYSVGLVGSWDGSAPVPVLLGQVVALALLAIWLGVAATAVTPKTSTVITLPAVLVLLTAAQARWPFGGLPGVGLGLGQAGGPLAPVARVGGELGLVAVVALAGAGLGVAFARRRLRVASGAVALAVAGVIAGWLAPNGSAVGSVRVAAVQGGGERGVGAMPWDEAFDRQTDAARRVPEGVDLVVLPEGTAHVRDEIEGTSEARELADLAERLGTVVAAGVVEYTDDRFRNSVMVWTPDRRLPVRYDKIRPVPFAESVPARPLLERLLDISELVPRDMVIGSRPPMLPTPVGRLGAAVSFEVFSGPHVAEAVRLGAEAVIVPTNAGSFTGRGPASMSLAAARLRAIESGRWVVPAAPSGYTAVVDPNGRVVAQSSLGADPAVLVESVELRRGSTPYVTTGDVPIVVLAAAALAAGWIRERREGGTARVEVAERG